jgi:hypothetical protein
MPKKYERQPPTRAHNPNPTHYLTSTQIRERYGNRSEMWLERILKTDDAFPRPIRIGRYRYWDLAKLETYEREVAANRR